MTNINVLPATHAELLERLDSKYEADILLNKKAAQVIREQRNHIEELEKQLASLRLELITAHGEAEELSEQLTDAKVDADRYRWLKAQHWDGSDLVVVSKPKVNLHLGAYCPSGEYLDEAIDAAMKESKA